MNALRIALIGHCRFPIAEPFAGGLESHVWALADGLRRKGHEVTLFAGPGSDPRLGVHELPLRGPQISDAARADVSMPPAMVLDEHHAYLDLMLRLARGEHGRFDAVHNHSLHHLPIALAPMLEMPMVSTLHTPPTPWLESAIQTGDAAAVTFVAVSRHTARAWRHMLGDIAVVSNGVDLARWPVGPGGGPAVWSGRIAPEKGTHLAIDAAVLAGVPLCVAGPITDPVYYADELAWRLRQPGVTYLGHLTHDQLSALVGRAGVALVTPCWDEPYGLVVAEALACGTPVCGFARGAVPDLLDAECGRLVAAGDVRGLAEAIAESGGLSRRAARRRAVAECSNEAMLDRHVALYETLAAQPAA
jgi:glycosyltransferase involved in cell wall biosynthesis